ncbi:MAG: exosortase system-associated protein, TIGR04073 family [Candidatus Omnitrophica bacterium]|nr:exosortase system-associated protein, TIGR04073 family [Candidatus Omnitrophota bacterium]
MKIVTIAIILLFAVSFGTLSFAESTQNISPANRVISSGVTSTVATEHGVGMKAERGIKNVLFGWTDIPRSIIQVTRDSRNPIWGLTAGTFKGIGKAFPRTVSGAADIITAPMGDYDREFIKSDELQTQIQ